MTDISESLPDAYTSSSIVRSVVCFCSLWPPCVADGDIIFLPCGFYLCIFFSSPNLSGHRLDGLPYFHTWCGPSANLQCRSEMCCTRLAANTGRKKIAKNRHLGTIAQLRRAISSQLWHVSTIGKNMLSSNSLRPPHVLTIW